MMKITNGTNKQITRISGCECISDDVPGHGFVESVYEEALGNQPGRSMPFERQKVLTVHYEYNDSKMM